MNKVTLAALALPALAGLAACSEANAPETDETVTQMESPVAPAPAAEDDGDNVSISEDGLSVDINDGDTSVSAEMGEDPSASVSTD